MVIFKSCFRKSSALICTASASVLDLRYRIVPEDNYNLPVFRGTGRSLDEELQQQWFLYCPEYSGHSVLLTLAASVICPFHDFPVTQLSFSV